MLESRSVLFLEILRTIKATQQYNWNGNFIFVETSKFIGHKRVFTGEYQGRTGAIRKMHPMGLIRIMGFSNKFSIPEDTPQVQKYRHSGNSIAVPILESILNKILKENNEK